MILNDKGEFRPPGWYMLGGGPRLVLPCPVANSERISDVRYFYVRNVYVRNLDVWNCDVRNRNVRNCDVRNCTT